MAALRISRRVFGDGTGCQPAVDPHRTAVEQHGLPRSQCVDELPRAIGSKAYEIDNGVGLELGDTRSEFSRRVLGLAIDLEVPNLTPR